MTKKDNPLRLRRLAARLSQTELAERAGIHRSSLVAIEEGQTRRPSDATLIALEGILGVYAGELGIELERWLDKQKPEWDIHQKALLRQSAATISRVYPSFKAWRLELGVPIHRLAAIIGVSRSTMLEYEAGIRRGGMPDTIMSGLLSIPLPSDVVLALAALPPADREDEPDE